jgi:hypothetical protein
MKGATCIADAAFPSDRRQRRQIFVVGVEEKLRGTDARDSQYL